jgi:hypothetical protein
MRARSMDRPGLRIAASTLPTVRVYATGRSTTHAISVLCRARTLQTYCLPFHSNPSRPGPLNDWWAAKRYADVRSQGLLTTPRDLAIQLSTDGLSATNKVGFNLTPVIVINLNLPPQTPYHDHNIMTALVIPDPYKQGDIDSFLYPLVEELKELGADINAYDAYRQQSFTLKAHAVLITGMLTPTTVDIH